MQIIILRPIKGALALRDFSCDCELIYIGGTLVCRFNNLNLPPAIEFSHQPVRSQSQYHYIKACLGMSAEPSQMWNQVIKFLQWVGVKKRKKKKNANSKELRSEPLSTNGDDTEQIWNCSRVASLANSFRATLMCLSEVCRIIQANTDQVLQPGLCYLKSMIRNASIKSPRFWV